MWQALEDSFGYRVLLAALLFAVLLGHDLIRNRQNPARAREYAFLLFATCLASTYGVLHDHVTATISSEYFLIGKNLAADPRPFRVAVTVLALKATFGLGLLGGALLLIANNPSPHRPQLSYRELARLCMVPLAAAAVLAIFGAALFAANVVGLRDVAEDFAGRGTRATRFLVTWGMHSGSYAGGLAGTIVALVLIRRGRRSRSGQGVTSADGALPGNPTDDSGR